MRINPNLTILMTLTSAELKGRYRNTIAGFLWVALNPIIMFGVHALVFKYIMKINTENYFIFLLSGLLPWIFISTNLNMTCNSFITNRETLLSFQIDPLLILASKVIDNFINFILPFLLIFFFLSFNMKFDLLGLSFLPINIFLLIVSSFSLSLIFATLQVYLRDTQYILNFALSILYFVTPIFYPAHMVPQFLKFLLKINPIYLVIKPFQVSLWNFNWQTYSDSLLNAIASSIILILLSTLIWRSKKNELYLNI